MKRFLAALVAIFLSPAVALGGPFRSDFDLIPQGPTSTYALPFNVGASWTPLYQLPSVDCFTCLTRTLFNYSGNPQPTFQIASLIVVSNPGAEIRLASFFNSTTDPNRDANNRVWTRTYPALSNPVGCVLCMRFADITATINAVIAANPAEQHAFTLEVRGSGTVRMAQVQAYYQ